MPENRDPPAGLLGVAAEHATSRVPVAHPGDSAGEVRAGLVGRSFECADDVVVLERSDVVGLLPIERLLAADPATEVAEIMDADPPVVTPQTAQEHVAWKMVDHGESSMVVIDSEGSYVGLIPPHRMLSVLLTEHDEDLARIGGYVAGAQRARQSAQEPVGHRLAHRLPWLLLGLLGAMGSAGIVGAFERQLDEKVLLAFFLPAVVYLADAVGTQTETLLIRGLSAGVTVREVLKRELITGAVIGIILGLAFLPFALAVWGDARVSIAVALSLVASCSIASIVAMALPWALQRLGKDPAFGSGPLATVIQDLLSIVVYLLIATAIAT